MATSLLDGVKNVRVSSVLNKDSKQFGKKHLLDGDDETCWNSDQGSPQWIVIEFSRQVQLKEVQLQFQGGFVGKDCCLQADMDGTFTQLSNFYPDDSNKLQTFPVANHNNRGRKFRILFAGSTDFYGRVTVYKLDLCGEMLDS